MAGLYKSVGSGERDALVHAIALLIECLDKKGIVSFEEYRNRLMAMWGEIPADDTSGASGVFKMLTDILTAAVEKKKAA